MIVLLKIGLFLLVTYLLAKTFTLSLERENEMLRIKIKLLKDKNKDERQKYYEKLNILNSAIRKDNDLPR